MLARRAGGRARGRGRADAGVFQGGVARHVPRGGGRVGGSRGFGFYTAVVQVDGTVGRETRRKGVLGGSVRAVQGADRAQAG